MRIPTWTTTARLLLAIVLALHAGTAGAVLDISKRLPKQPDDGSHGTPVGSSGGGGDGPVCAPDPEQCLGVVGLGCDGVLSTEAETALVVASGAIGASAIVFAGSVLETAYSGCTPDGSCAVNAGSWDHDECCYDHPSGHFCGIENAFASGSCTAAWNEALHRTIHGLSWRARPDRCRVDDDGEVDFPTYCAPPGTIVAAGDRAKCCGRRTRRFDLVRDGLQAVFQRLILDNTYTPRVCVGRGPTGTSGSTTGGGSGGTTAPVGPTCATSAACPAGSVCVSLHAGEPKRCVAA